VTVAIVDYGSGNLHSAAKAFERAAAEADSSDTILVTSDPETVRRAERIVLPGVGAFADCRRGLDAVPGMVEALTQAVRRDGRPFLGICVGMQMLYHGSEEVPDVPGLGVLPGIVRQLPEAVKRPQIQWNRLDVRGDSTLLTGLEEESWVYFVHSYAAEPDEHTVATCDYGGPMAAVVERGRLSATQFHPEKSGDAGAALLRNWVGSLS
jgi:imidazole glycerol-phosphate synthase subunit HisH